MAMELTPEKIPNRNRSSMNMEVSKLFVDATFPESSRLAALDMLGEIRVQFNKTLQQKGWMDEQTREKVTSAHNHGGWSLTGCFVMNHCFQCTNTILDDLRLFADALCHFWTVRPYTSLEGCSWK
jgi:hypothetical protein